MKPSFIAVLFSIAVLLAGCVTPEATKRPADGVNLRQFQQLKLTVTNSVFTQYAIESKPQFEGLLKGTLQSLGYSLVDTNAQIILDVDVIELEPGSRGTRAVTNLRRSASRASQRARAGRHRPRLHAGRPARRRCRR